MRSTRRVLATQIASVNKMQIDAARIAELQSKPQQAIDREKPNDELLAQIEAALHEANVPRELWQDSIPQPPQRDKAPDYLRVTTRLEFENITLQQVASLAHQLLNADPALQIQSMRVQNRRSDIRKHAHQIQWNIEMAVAHLVYDPKVDEI